MGPKCSLFVLVVAFALAPLASAQMAPEKAVTGTMQIDFRTRTAAGQEAGKPKAGVLDTYNVALLVNGTRAFNGKIERAPRVKGWVMTAQQAGFTYDLTLSAVNSKDPSQRRSVGKWVGLMPFEPANGAYLLDGGGEASRQLRFAVDAIGKQAAFTSNFAGRLIGKPEQKSVSWETITRKVKGKTVEVKFQPDPLRFEGVTLAAGPDAGRYPLSVVNGDLNYDRETGNYYANLRNRYTAEGKEHDDQITGSIKWVDAGSGKGQYEFNLRWNEDKNQPAGDVDAAFAPAGGEDVDLFFAVDTAVPALTGTVKFTDTPGPNGPTASQVEYDLRANKLTEQQVMNFVKLWLIAVGPTNDE